MKKLYLALLIASLILGTMLFVSCEQQTTTAPSIENPEHVHEFAEEVVEPTCNVGGYTHYVCECGYEYRDSFTNPDSKKHEYKETVVEPTCTKDGYTKHVCEVCGDSYEDKTVPARHVYTTEYPNGWYYTIEPSCQTQGMQRRDCVYCSYYEEKQVPAAHPFEVVVTDPTCEAEGYITYTCSECEYSYIEKGAKALGHDFTGSEWYVYTPSTCQTKGEERRDCTRCDGYEQREIPKHNFDTPVHEDATCENPGYDGYVCSDCGERRIDTIIPAHGHKFGDEWHDVVGMPGYEQRECENGCGKVEVRVK
jgi:hypothetical protein